MPKTSSIRSAVLISPTYDRQTESRTGFFSRRLFLAKHDAIHKTGST